MAEKIYTFIVLYTGAGNLSEGFARAEFIPIVHIEMNKNACDTLKTRAATIWGTMKSHNHGVTSLKQAVSSLKIIEKAEVLGYGAI